jgi:hypothetical protein
MISIYVIGFEVLRVVVMASFMITVPTFLWLNRRASKKPV